MLCCTQARDDDIHSHRSITIAVNNLPQSLNKMLPENDGCCCQ